VQGNTTGLRFSQQKLIRALRQEHDKQEADAILTAIPY